MCVILKNFETGYHINIWLLIIEVCNSEVRSYFTFYILINKWKTLIHPLFFFSIFHEFPF